MSITSTGATTSGIVYRVFDHYEGREPVYRDPPDVEADYNQCVKNAKAEAMADLIAEGGIESPPPPPEASFSWGVYKGPENHHKATGYYASYWDTPGVKKPDET